MQILAYLFFLAYFFLPTFFANGAPVVAKNIIFFSDWKAPISEKYLWKNKTYRGLVVWILIAIIMSILQYFLTDFLFFRGVVFSYYHIVYSFPVALSIGFFQGFWALFWDIVKSFVKRKVGIKPWEAWPVIDGIDYVIGSLVCMTPFYIPTFFGIIFIVFIWPLSSLVANTIAYFLWWKDVWY